jgi:two-component system cell cycle sensor histidine kinase/response regulator CckA
MAPLPRRQAIAEQPPAGAPTPIPNRPVASLRAVVEGTVRAYGEDFFPALAASLCRALHLRYAVVGALTTDGAGVRMLGGALDGRIVNRERYSLEGSPCGVTLAKGATSFIPSGVKRLFPASGAAALGMDAYLGTPLFDSAGRKLGVLCVMNDGPLDLALGPREVIEIFAQRAASELERTQLQDALVHAQRLDGMGRLAAGIAHDFNNLLTVILANAEFAYGQLPAGSPIRDFLAPIHDASHRASALTRQLLTFARRQPSAPEVFQLRARVADLLRLLGRMLAGRVALRSKLETDWAVRIDPGQLEQVLVNLAINARDAMPKGGTVEIAAVGEELDASGASALGVGAGDWIHLSVSDDGAGMDEATRGRCFEPFFTTKGDRGTGLGLATCHGIVAQAGGRIWVESAPGMGTTFHILFPRHAGTGWSPGVRAPARAAPGPRRGTVLVVEDDVAVQEAARRTLEQAGWRVLVAGDGAAGLAALAAEPGPVELLVTDLVLPGLSGPELSAQARVLRPSLRVLFASGFVDEATLAGLEKAGDPILLKPYTPNDLAHRVEELFES